MGHFTFTFQKMELAMGSWGAHAFDNDNACDWAIDLEKVDDLTLVAAAFANVPLDVAKEVDPGVAEIAFAACEVLACLCGHTSGTGSPVIDQWVAIHPLEPSKSMLRHAISVIDRLLDENCELQESWGNAGTGDEIRTSLEDLRLRLQDCLSS